MDPLASRWLRHAAVVALLVWVAFGFARETAGAVRGWRHRTSYDASPISWRFGAPRQERLQRCLASAAEIIPPRSRVAIVGGQPDLHFWRWATYLLPAHEVLPTPGPRAPAAQFVVAVGPHPPVGQRLRGGRWCAVYRAP